MQDTTTQNEKPTATFMMGGPGAGKGYTRKRLFPETKVLDCDEIKKTLPGYDPKNPMATHEESRQILARQFFAQLASNESFLYDGTGSNAEKYVRLIKQAKEAGFETQIVYVTCPLATALERNEKRERTVPAAIVIEKHETIEESFEIVSLFADKVQKINNK